MLHVLFHADGVVADISEEALEGYLPADESCTSTLALRYKSENGQAVDMYLGKTDQEVLDLIKLAAEQDIVIENKAIDRIDFFNLFTIEELAGVYTAAKDNVLLQILLDKVKVAAKVELGNSDVIQGVGLLTQMGILTEERAATILQG